MIAMKLSDVWPNFPDPAGRPTRPFFVVRRITVIKRIRPSVGGSNAGGSDLAPPADIPALPADDRPAVARDYDEEQRELGRMLAMEGIPIAAEMALDGARTVFDFLKSVLAPRATPPQGATVAVVAPPGPSPAPSLPGGPGSQDRVDNRDKGFEPAYSGGPGALRGPIVGKESVP